MRKWVLTTITPVENKEEVRLVPAKNERAAREKAKEDENIVSCVPYQGGIATYYMKLHDGIKNAKRG